MAATRAAQAEKSLRNVAAARRALDRTEAEAVHYARELGYSWDRISALLGGRPTGEGLRVRYAGPVLDDRGQVAALGGYQPKNR